MSEPRGVLSPELLPASLAIYTTIALVAFEGLAVAAAIPQLTADLGRVALLPWVMTGYLLASGIATVVAGPLVDALGTRAMFRWAVTTFTVASLICGLAPSMPLLVAARVAQGVGGGLIVAVGLAAVSLVYPGRLVGRAFAANSTVWGAMGVAGPAIAAVLLTVADWRWIFWVNAPLGLAALALGWRAFPGPLAGSEPARLDPLGISLLVGFNLSALVAVDSLAVESVPWLVVAAASAWAYTRWARRRDRPVLRLEHVIRQPYAGLAAGVALSITGAIGLNAYLPVYVQGARGAGTALTAWSVLFFTVGWTLGSNLAGRLTDRLAESTVVLAGTAVTASSLFALWATSSTDAPLAVLFALFVAAGVGVGAATNAALTLLRAVTPPTRIGRAAAAHQFVRNQGFVFGAGLGGAVMLAVVGSRIGDVDAVQELLSGTAGPLAPRIAEAVAAGFTSAAGVCAALAGAALVPVWALRRHLAEARAARREGRQEGRM
jgi:MFS family permease